MVQVYREELCRRHYGGMFSAAWIFRVVVFLSAIVLAFTVAYATGGFWRKVNTEMEQPTVHYSGDALAIFEGSVAGQEQVFATSPALQAALADKLVAASVQVGEEDWNFDGKPDAIRFSARVSSATPIHSVKLLLQFTYGLQTATKVQMYGLAYVTASSPLQGAGFSTDGQLMLRQLAPLARGTYMGAYSQAPLNSSGFAAGVAANPAAAVQLGPLLAAYNLRNLTTVYQDQYPVWTAGNGNQFDLQVTVRIPPNQLTLYRPDLAEVLKWGWVQFLSIYVILAWLLAWFEGLVFRSRVLDTRVLSDVQAPRGPKY